MAGQLDARMLELAKKLLQKYGKPAVFTSVGEGAYTPGGELPTTSENFDITCYIDEDMAGQLKSSGLIQASSILVLVSAKELGALVVPDNTDFLEIDGAVFPIIKDLPIWSGEFIALHRLECKSS